MDSYRTSSPPHNQNSNAIQGNLRLQRTPSGVRGDDSKGKVMELQEEISRLRRELAQRECTYKREKNGLLSRVQILTMENAEIRQRQQNLAQINLTLELALKSKDQCANRQEIKENAQIAELQEEVQERGKALKEAKRQIQDLKKRLRASEDERQRQKQENEGKIEQLTRRNKQFQEDQQDYKRQIQESLTSLPLSKDALQAIFRALNSHLQPDLTCEDLDFPLEESPVTRRHPHKQDTSLSRISCHSIISQLNRRQTSQYSQQESYEQEQHLLCELCRKVFSQKEFVAHMQQCSQLYELQQKRQHIEREISHLDQHRSSHSRKKMKVQERPWDRDSSAVRRRENKQGRQGRDYRDGRDGGNGANGGNVHARAPLQIKNNYRSNKFY